MDLDGLGNVVKRDKYQENVELEALRFEIDRVCKAHGARCVEVKGINAGDNRMRLTVGFD